MSAKYIVNLTPAEREQLHHLTRQGKTAARRLKRAHILLLSDEGYDDATIARMLHVGESTVHRTRQRCVEEGVEPALGERPRPGGKRKLDGNVEAFLVATACSEPPEGRECWTMQLLADRLIELQLVDTVSAETVRQTLKKTNCDRGRRSSGASPK